MRAWPILLYLLVATLPAVPLSAQPAQQTPFGESPDRVTPPLRVPVVHGPVITGPTYLPDGRIGINGPYTITSPGHYLLLRDIADNETIIRVVSSDVELDLGGHELFTYEPEWDPPAVSVGTVGGPALHGITIRNGTIEVGYYIQGMPSLRFYGEGNALVLEDLTIRWGMVLTGWTDVQVARIAIHGMRTGAGFAARACSVTNSSFSGSLSGMGFRFDNCVVSQNSFGADWSIYISGSSNVIHHNMFYVDWLGEVVDLRGENNHFSHNNVGARFVLGHGSSHNHIVGNLFWPSHSPVIRFDPTTSENVYRANTSTGEGEGIDDQGEGNVSHGDNFMPDPM